jgi:hypothetical protein
MAGPWEAYAAPAAAGPWTQYQGAPPASSAPTAQEAPNVLERIGHGADRTVGGIHQAFLELKNKVAPSDKSAQDLKDYTANLNDEESLYQKGRGKDAGIDWASLGGSAGMGAPLMLIPGAGEGLLARAGMGALQGGLDAAAQPTATGSMLDRAKQAGIGTLTGAVAAPIAGTISDKLVGALNTVKGRASGLVADKSAARVLQDVPDLANAPQAVRGDLIKEAQAQIAQSGKLDAAAIARKANLLANDVTPTTSMVTRDPAQWTRERNLQKLAQSPDEALSNTGQELTRVYQGNDQALTAKMSALAKPYGAATQEGRGMTVMGSLDDLAKSSQKDVSAVYDTVRSARGEELASDARNLHSTLDELSDSPAADPVTEAAKRRLKKLGMLDADGNLTDKSLTVTQAEGLRQFINQQPNVFGKSQIIKAIDTDVIGGLGEDAFKGARAGAKQRFDMLNNPTTQKSLNNFGELTQGRAAQSLIKSQIISAPEQDVASLLTTIGKIPNETQRSAAIGAIRGGVMEHLQDAALKQNGQFSGTALTKAMDAIGPNKLKMVLGNDAHAQLDSLARAGVDATYEPAYGAVNHSNTAPMLLSLVKGGRGLIGPNLPLINDTVVGALEKHAARSDAAGKLTDALSASIGKPKGGLSPELQKRLAALLSSGAAQTAATGVNQLLQPSR